MYDLTVRLSFHPGQAAQVDFGADPFLMHRDGQMRRTWAFRFMHDQRQVKDRCAFVALLIHAPKPLCHRSLHCIEHFSFLGSFLCCRYLSRTAKKAA